MFNRVFVVLLSVLVAFMAIEIFNNMLDRRWRPVSHTKSVTELGQNSGAILPTCSLEAAHLNRWRASLEVV